MSNIMWQPTAPHSTRMWQFKCFVEKKYHIDITDYTQLHRWSVNHLPQFWDTLCQYLNLSFDTPAKQVLNEYDHMINAQWFNGATLNYAEKLLGGEHDKIAIISLNEQGVRRTLTYHELRQEVAQCAAGLRRAGIKKNDRVAAIMPNSPQTIIAFLATACIGAIWSSCSPDFGLEAALDRVGQIKPKLLFITDKHQYQGKSYDDFNKIKTLQHDLSCLQHIVVYTEEKNPEHLSRLPNILSWDALMVADAELSFTSTPFSHPLYILFSSGTTGKPKCLVHSSGGSLLQHMKELALHTDIQSKDNLFFYTTCGWMMWNWMVSVLSLGATLTLYDGSPTYPDTSRLFDIISQEKVTVFGTSAKYLSAIEKAGFNPGQSHTLSSLRCILSTGSPLLPKNYDFVYQQIKPDIQLSSISGGTDIVSCFALGNPIKPIYRGEIQCIGLGMSVDILDENKHAVKEKRGELVCTKPFPSMPVGFWHDADKSKYKKAYFNRFPGVWAHGDFAELTSHQGLIIYGRSDAVLNPGGIRIGTAEIYRQVEKIPDVIDSVVVGQDWEEDTRVILFVKLRDHLELTPPMIEKIKQTIRTHASPRHVPAKIIQVKDIPRTISGKTVEIAVRQTIHNQPIENIASLANPEALEYFKNLPILQS